MKYGTSGRQRSRRPGVQVSQDHMPHKHLSRGKNCVVLAAASLISQALSSQICRSNPRSALSVSFSILMHEIGKPHIEHENHSQSTAQTPDSPMFSEKSRNVALAVRRPFCICTDSILLNRNLSKGPGWTYRMGSHEVNSEGLAHRTTMSEDEI